MQYLAWIENKQSWVLDKCFQLPDSSVHLIQKMQLKQSHLLVVVDVLLTVAGYQVLQAGEKW